MNHSEMMMANTDTQEVRRANLRRLVNDHEGMNNLARKLGMGKGAYISQLLTDPPVRKISEKTARKWEQLLSLPSGWLDGATQKVANTPIDSSLLAQVLAEVNEALKGAKVTLNSQQMADLVAMQYADALPTGRVDAGRIHTIVALIKR